MARQGRTASRRDDDSSGVQRDVPLHSKSSENSGNSRNQEIRAKSPKTSAGRVRMQTGTEYIGGETIERNGRSRSRPPDIPKRNRDKAATLIQDENFRQIEDCTPKSSSSGHPEFNNKARLRSKSEERSINKIVRQYLPPSHYAAAAGLNGSAIRSDPVGHDKVTDAKKASYVPVFEETSSQELGRDKTHASPNPRADNKAGMSGSLRRRSSWGKNRGKQAEVDASRLSRRASQLGLPELEKDLLPSLRDTVDKMTQPQVTEHVAGDSYHVRSASAYSPASSSGNRPIATSVRSPSIPSPFIPSRDDLEDQKYIVREYTSSRSRKSNCTLQ